MDWGSWSVIGGVIVAALTIYNFVVGVGRKSGATDAQLAYSDANEKNWSIRFAALEGSLQLHQSQTSERFERVVEKLNQALLIMAKEHATKADLHLVKSEIIDRMERIAEKK